MVGRNIEEKRKRDYPHYFVRFCDTRVAKGDDYVDTPPKFISRSDNL